MISPSSSPPTVTVDGRWTDYDERTFTHECPDQGRLNVILYVWGGSGYTWSLDDCDSKLVYIKFCPYCGVHLPAPEFQG